MDLDRRGIVSRSLEDTAYWNKSPFIQGFITGVKGALLGAGGGAAANAMRGGSASKGAIIGGLGVGLLSGLTAAAAQDVSNTNTEAAMRYHLMRLQDREPTLYLPPPRVFGPLFSRLHRREHAQPSETSPDGNG